MERMKEIDMTQTTTDTPAMFSTREVPWMKLGKLVDKPVTAAEAAKLAGMDFTVREEPVYYGNPGKMKKVEGRKALVRDDTNDWLSIVSKDYPIVQYADAFDFMDGVNPEFVAAGLLRKGKQGFMVVEVAKMDVAGTDPHTLYGILRTSHDCSRAVEVSAMPLRHRCMNQLTLATFSKSAQYRWSIVHSGNVKSKLAAASESLTKLSQYAAVYEMNATRLLEIKVTDERVTEVLRWVLPDRPKRDEKIQTIITGWHENPETVGFDGTGWGLVNAISEHFDWQRSGGTAESRFLGALQGDTHKMINRAATYMLTRS